MLSLGFPKNMAVQNCNEFRGKTLPFKQNPEASTKLFICGSEEEQTGHTCIQPSLCFFPEALFSSEWDLGMYLGGLSWKFKVLSLQ